MSDEQRIKLSVRKGNRREGPLEGHPCFKHPDQEEFWQWIWSATEDPQIAIQNAIPHMVKMCPLCHKKALEKIFKKE